MLGFCDDEIHDRDAHCRIAIDVDQDIYDTCHRVVSQDRHRQTQPIESPRPACGFGDNNTVNERERERKKERERATTTSRQTRA